MVRTKHIATKRLETKFHSPKAKARNDSVFSEKSLVPDKGFHDACMNN